MKATVIIPSHRSQTTLPRTLESIRVAAARFCGDVETLVSEDFEGRGASWARNRGLDRASGGLVFFVDADDIVDPDFFVRPATAITASDADFCLFQYAQSPLRRDYDLSGGASVRAALLPAFAGYSFDDVRRWNSGGDLMARREPGSVCRVAFRRDFLARHRLRFDECLPIYEDAAFLAECALCASRVVSLRESLYGYCPRPSGTTATVSPGSSRHLRYKFAVLERRKLLEATYGGFWRFCEASCVFSVLELLRTGTADDVFRYADDPLVRRAIADFPLAWRHPLVAAAVTYCRCRFCPRLDPQKTGYIAPGSVE